MVEVPIHCDTNGEGNEANVYVANTAGQLVVLLDDVDECSNGQNNCSQNATCTDLTPNAVGDPGYSCACNQYYEGDGITCTDIDECATNNGGCHVNAICTNAVGGERTCTCFNGYTGDGINNCDEPAGDTCSNGAQDGDETGVECVGATC